MHILSLILAVAGVAGLFLWRAQSTARAAKDIVEAAETVQGAYRRHRFRTGADAAPLRAVEDPVVAAAAMLAAIARQRGRVSRAAEEAILRELKETIGAAEAREILDQALWLSDQVIDPNTLSRTYAKLWRTRLTATERGELAAMAARIAAVDGPPNGVQQETLTWLRERLDLNRPGPG